MRKCWLPAFSPFPTMFSKGIFPQGCQKSSLCVKWFNMNMAQLLSFSKSELAHRPTVKEVLREITCTDSRKSTFDGLKWKVKKLIYGKFLHFFCWHCIQISKISKIYCVCILKYCHYSSSVPPIQQEFNLLATGNNDWQRSLLTDFANLLWVHLTL